MRLENCRFTSSVDWPSDIIDLENSVEPYVLEWAGCSKYDGSQLQYFEDGEFVAGTGLKISAPP